VATATPHPSASGVTAGQPRTGAALGKAGGPLARHRVALLGVLALALWGLAAASAGIRPYALAVVGAQLPADFGRDFVAAEARLADGRVYEPAPDLAERLTPPNPAAPS
jgi:hypothetical protein